MFGLNPDKWIDGEHCLNGEWIIELMVGGAVGTVFFYYIFCVLALLMWKIKGSWLATNNFFLWLSAVFFLCGTIHLGHALGKIVPEFYLITLAYPALVLSMLFTLLNAFSLYDRVRTFIPKDRVEVLERQLERLEKILDDNGISHINSWSTS